jgi:hypothetical protein
LCAQSRPSPQLRSQSLDRPQRRRADVMLHSFDIMVNHAIIDTEQSQKIGEEFVPVRDLAGEPRSSRR